LRRRAEMQKSSLGARYDGSCLKSQLLGMEVGVLWSESDLGKGMRPFLKKKLKAKVLGA
jgi:hypothetical protein